MKAAFLLTEDRVQLVLSPQTKTETAILDLLHDGQDKVVEAHRANFVERNGYSGFPPTRVYTGGVETPKDTLLVVSRRTPEPKTDLDVEVALMKALRDDVHAAMCAVPVRCYDPNRESRGGGMTDQRCLDVANGLKSDLVEAALEVFTKRGLL